MVLDDGVADISRSREMATRAHAIWNVLADFGSLSSWAANVDHSCVLNRGPDGEAVGTTRRVQIGRNTLLERIVESHAPISLTYEIEGLPRRLGLVTNRWTLCPVGTRTVVTVTSTVEIGPNPVARTAAWVVCRGMARESDSMLAGLARRLEGPA